MCGISGLHGCAEMTQWCDGILWRFGRPCVCVFLRKAVNLCQTIRSHILRRQQSSCLNICNAPQENPMPISFKICPQFSSVIVLTNLREWALTTFYLTMCTVLVPSVWTGQPQHQGLSRSF